LFEVGKGNQKIYTLVGGFATLRGV